MISGKGGREVGGDAKEPGLCWSQCGTAQEAAFRDTRIPVHAIAAAAGRQGRAHQGMVQDRILEPTRQAHTQDHEDFERVIGDATVEVKIWPFFCYSPPDGYGGHSCQQQRNERFRVVRLPVRE